MDFDDLLEQFDLDFEDFLELFNAYVEEVYDGEL